MQKKLPVAAILPPHQAALTTRNYFVEKQKEDSIAAPRMLFILHANILWLPIGWWCTDRRLESAPKAQESL